MAGFDYEKAFEDLEDHVARVRHAARLCSYLAHEDMKQRADGSFEASRFTGEMIRGAAEIAEFLADDLESRWQASHNAGAEAGLAALAQKARSA